MKARLIYAVALQHPNLMERVQQTPNFPGNIVEIYETREEAVQGEECKKLAEFDFYGVQFEVHPKCCCDRC